MMDTSWLNLKANRIIRVRGQIYQKTCLFDVDYTYMTSGYNVKLKFTNIKVSAICTILKNYQMTALVLNITNQMSPKQKRNFLAIFGNKIMNKYCRFIATLIFKSTGNTTTQLFENKNFIFIKTIILNQGTVNAEGLALLAKIQFKHLQFLNIADNIVSNKGIYFIAKGNWPSLKYLVINNASLTTDCTKYLTKHRFHKLEKICMTNNSLLPITFQKLISTHQNKKQNYNRTIQQQQTLKDVFIYCMVRMQESGLEYANIKRRLMFKNMIVKMEGVEKLVTQPTCKQQISKIFLQKCDVS